MLLEVLSYIFDENAVFFIHVLNLFVLVTLIILFVFARRTGRKWTKVNDYLGVITNTVNSIRYGDLTKKIEKISGSMSHLPCATSAAYSKLQHPLLSANQYG